MLCRVMKTPANPIANALRHSEFEFRASQALLFSPTQKVLPSKLAAEKAPLGRVKKSAAHSDDDPPGSPRSDKGFDVALAANTSADAPVESFFVAQVAQTEAVSLPPDEQIASLPSASVLSGSSTLVYLAGGLGLAAAGGGGGSSTTGDGTGGGNVKAPPVIISESRVSFAENSSGIAYQARALVDTAGTPLTYSISGTDAALFDVNANTGAISFKRTPDFEFPDDAGADNVYNLVLQVSDGNLMSMQDVAITVTNVNETLKITSETKVSLAENSTGIAYQARALVDIAGTPLTYSIGGTDAALFNVNANTGDINFKRTPDFEFPDDAGADNVYNLVLQVSDGKLMSTQDVAITVTNVNETLKITSETKVSLAENSTGIVYQATTMVDAAGTPLTYNISGTDAALFNVNANTGAISFKRTPDFEFADDAGADNVYNLVLQVSDGNLMSMQDVAITVTDASDIRFKLNFRSNFSLEAKKGFQEAAKFWSSVLSDDVVINMDLDYRSDGFVPNILGEADSERIFSPYIDVYKALNADVLSAADKAALASLSPSSSFDMLLNHTRNSPNQSNLATPYLDNNGNGNNSTINLTRANAKALGLLEADDSAIDVQIAFNSGRDSSFDFDRGDGISARRIDFVGVAIHEMGHALGFASGIEALDSFADRFDDASFQFVHPLDLFRYSELSTEMGVIDWSTSKTDKYFSLDKGQTKIASFSTGLLHGDGAQDSHWKDGLGLGVLDPSSGSGLLKFTNLDLLAFDVIGWNLRESSDNFATPEITSVNTVNYLEKTSATAYTVVAADADAWNRMSFSISGGEDANRFSINEQTGVIKFLSAPNFAKPDDANANNIYNINVRASDGIHLSPELAVSIRVIPNTQSTRINFETIADTTNNFNPTNPYDTYQVL